MGGTSGRVGCFSGERVRWTQTLKSSWNLGSDLTTCCWGQSACGTGLGLDAFRTSRERRGCVEPFAGAGDVIPRPKPHSNHMSRFIPIPVWPDGGAARMQKCSRGRCDQTKKGELPLCPCMRRIWQCASDSPPPSLEPTLIEPTLVERTQLNLKPWAQSSRPNTSSAPHTVAASE